MFLCDRNGWTGASKQSLKVPGTKPNTSKDCQQKIMHTLISVKPFFFRAMSFIQSLAEVYQRISSHCIDGFRGGAERGSRSPFFLVFSKLFWNVNVTLLLHVLKSEVFFRGCGWGWGGWETRPPLSEFSGTAPALDQSIPTHPMFCNEAIKSSLGFYWQRKILCFHWLYQEVRVDFELTLNKA